MILNIVFLTIYILLYFYLFSLWNKGKKDPHYPH